MISKFSGKEQSNLEQLLQQCSSSSLALKIQEKHFKERFILIFLSLNVLVNLGIGSLYFREKDTIAEPLYHVNEIQSLRLNEQLTEIKRQQELKFPLKAPSKHRISSDFGWRIHPIYRYRLFHNGIDFATPYGAPVLAAAEGIVTYSGWRGGYGRTIMIEHENGLITLYGHNSQLLKRKGERVKSQEMIAKSGSTGISTGPHIHFEVHKEGEPVNPDDYLLY